MCIWSPLPAPLLLTASAPAAEPLPSHPQNLCEPAKWPQESCTANCQCPSNLARCAGDGQCLVRAAAVAPAVPLSPASMGAGREGSAA